MPPMHATSTFGLTPFNRRISLFQHAPTRHVTYVEREIVYNVGEGRHHRIPEKEDCL